MTPLITIVFYIDLSLSVSVNRECLGVDIAMSNTTLLASTRWMRLCLCLGALAVLMCGGLRAQAQSPSPRVFVIFDTSGSMLWNYLDDVDCYGDGSVDYPHRNGCTNQVGSRLFHAKRALAQVITASPQVEFALLRYGQLEPQDPDFGTLQTSVGAQYRDAAGQITPPNYDGSTNGCGPADYLVSPSANSNDEVLEWIDHLENYPGDKELRANGYTPLTFSLESAQDAIRETISLDPEAQCRSYYVLMLTDGYQQCPGEDFASAEYRALVSNQLQLNAESLRQLNEGGNLYDVRTFVVGFGPGTEFASELDSLARSGGTAVNAAGQPDLFNGTAYQANDPSGLAEVLQNALDNARPRETCDGIDNDCDGQIDEDFPALGQPCQEGLGECRAQGEVVCALDGLDVICSTSGVPGAAEVCDNNDNDCDGRIDEGVTNACGTCGDAQEVCDGRDNDCDQAIDEGVTNRCGECGNLALEVCDNDDNDCDGRTDEGVLNACGGCGEVDLEVCDCNDNDCDSRIDEGLGNCPQCNCEPSPEQCDGLDNDCDLQIDEGVQNACNRCGPDLVEVCNGLDEDCDGQIDEDIAEVGMACGVNAGACQAGVYRCVNSQLICDGEVAPLTEVCDSVDNDCDGQFEEGLLNACGQCGPGYGEICDNIDNDCDGEDDTRDLCGDDQVCVNGECTQPCADGECFGGRICVEGGCSTPCVNRDCPSGHVCQNGLCVDPCLGFECREGTYCSLGRCLPNDCYGLGCPEGEICVGAVCQPDPCATAGCGPQQGCIDGRCFDDCDAVTCPNGTACENGLCTDDPCLRTSCQHNEVCLNGSCLPDPCFEQECDLGFMCDQGQCIEDPCLRTTCPAGDTCHRGVCSSAIPNATPPTDPTELGGEEVVSIPTETPSGCQCDARQSRSSNEPIALFILWLAVAMTLRRAHPTAEDQE